MTWLLGLVDSIRERAWRLNPMRAMYCGDLRCKCLTCTTPECPCSLINQGTTT